MATTLLRLVTCGSVDDGKSTLIGRLLFDAKGIFEDQLAAVEKATTRYGTTGGKLDLALLTDGLKAEREQGITIDVAYRYFSTPARPFIIADCPGHEQYTRNMATGASTADVAILLIDARHGVVTQTRRHAYIVSLLGIREIVLAVNKIDLVNWSQAKFDEIVAAFGDVAEAIGITANVQAIPMSALTGDNVTARSPHMPWHTGPALLEYLESLEVEDLRNRTAMRLPVQLVSRPDMHFRGYMGEVAGGEIRPGDEVVVLPGAMGGGGTGGAGGGIRTRVAKVFNANGETDVVRAGDAATVTLTGEQDASRGDVIASSVNPPTVATRVLAHIVWFSPEPGPVGGLYRLKQGTRLALGTLAAIRHGVEVNSLEKRAVDRLNMNDIALCEVESNRPLVFDAYEHNRRMGAFILIDRVTSNTVAAGMIVGQAGVAPSTGPVTAFERAARMGQRRAVVSVLGNHASALAAAVALDRKLFSAGHFSAVVDETDDTRKNAAIRALAAAGVIAVIVGPAATQHVIRTDAPPRAGEPVEKMYRELSDAGLLSAPERDFEI